MSHQQTVPHPIAAIIGLTSLAVGGMYLLGGGAGDPLVLTLLYALGASFATYAVILLYRDRNPEIGIETPDVEQAKKYPTPGGKFDETLAQFSGESWRDLRNRRVIHDRLEDLAATILARRRSISQEEAHEAINSGVWPDDDIVSAFLRDPETKVPISWQDRFGSLFSENSDFQRLVRRTVDTLATQSELVDVGDPPSRIVSESAIMEKRSEASKPLSNTGNTPKQSFTETVDSRWYTLFALALSLVGLGLFVRQASVVLAGVVPMGLLAYTQAFTSPSPTLSIERSIDIEDPEPGTDVEVTVTLHNEGDSLLSDLRVIDGVPPDLAVSDGSPRYGTALPKGESVTFSYTVTARRGVHEFQPSCVLVRNLPWQSVQVCFESVSGDSATSLICVSTYDPLPVSVPLHEQASEHLGRLPGEGGEGVEFHGIREYRPGDSTTRIDWKRFAKSPNEDLRTTEFREENAATVALVINTDHDAYLSPEADKPNSVERSIDATGALVGSLLTSGERVGVAALGPTPLWISPDTGVAHLKRVESSLATSPPFQGSVSDEKFSPRWAREFHRRFPAATQVILLSPLSDTRYRFVIQRLRAYGHPVTVISPDPTVDETVGQRLASLERRIQVEELRESGVPVIDWDTDEDLAVELQTAASRWSF